METGRWVEGSGGALGMAAAAGGGGRPAADFSLVEFKWPFNVGGTLLVRWDIRAFLFIKGSMKSESKSRFWQEKKRNKNMSQCPLKFNRCYHTGYHNWVILFILKFIAGVVVNLSPSLSKNKQATKTKMKQIVMFNVKKKKSRIWQICFLEYLNFLLTQLHPKFFERLRQFIWIIPLRRVLNRSGLLPLQAMADLFVLSERRKQLAPFHCQN